MNRKCHENQSHKLRCTRELHTNLEVSRKSESRFRCTQKLHMNQKCHANQSHELRCTHEVHMNFSIVTHIRVTNSDVHQNYMNLKVSRKSESRTQMCHATQSHELSVSPLLTMSYIKIHHVTHTNDQNQGRLQLFHA